MSKYGDYAERMQELKDRHSERLRALAVSTKQLKEHNDKLELNLSLPPQVRKYRERV